MIPTVTAARLLRLSRSMFLRTMKVFKLKPVSRRLTAGKPEGLWSKSQVFGAMLAGALARLGVSEGWCEAFPGLLAASYGGDEQLEASLDSGRRYLFIAGASCLPELLTADEVEERLKDNQDTLKRLQIQTARLDVSECFADLMAAVRTLRAAEEFA